MIRSRQGHPKPARRSPATSDRDDADNGLYVASVEKAFRVLEALNRAGRPVGLSEVRAADWFWQKCDTAFSLYTSGHSDMSIRMRPPSHIASRPRCLSSGALISVPTSFAIRLGRSSRPRTASADETVNLTVLDREDVVYVLRFPESSRRQRQPAVGSRLPAYCTAPGRVDSRHTWKGARRRRSWRAHHARRRRPIPLPEKPLF